MTSNIEEYAPKVFKTKVLTVFISIRQHQLELITTDHSSCLDDGNNMPKSQSDDLSFNALINLKIDNKTKPVNSLGRIESLAKQIADIQENLSPVMDTCRLTIFAADHGMAAAGVSAFPQIVTQQMVLNFLNGGAAANVFARSAQVDLQVVDAGVAGEAIEHPNLISRRIAPGTHNAIIVSAMTEAQLSNAIEHGKEIGEAGDWDAVCYGEMGIGNTSSATLLAHKTLGLSLDILTGRGTGLDDDGLAKKRNLLEQASNRTPQALSPKQALMEYGGFEIAMMTGAMLGAASTNKLIIVDGFIASAAALMAIKLDATVQKNMVFAHLSDELGHAAMLKAMRASPILDLKLRLGEGTGALLAWPIIKAAAAMLNEMASFESANVSEGT